MEGVKKTMLKLCLDENLKKILEWMNKWMRVSEQTSDYQADDCRKLIKIKWFYLLVCRALHFRVWTKCVKSCCATVEWRHERHAQTQCTAPLAPSQNHKTQWQTHSSKVKTKHLFLKHRTRQALQLRLIIRLRLHIQTPTSLHGLIH